MQETISIAPEDRFAAMTPAGQAAVREAVLAARIATVEHAFNGNFGTSLWPSNDFDLVHVKQRLDQIGITFSDLSTVQKLTIAVDDDGWPHIDFALSLARIDATIHMERWPGLWFWLLAPETLIAAGIVVGVTAAAVAGAIVATLMGLGPLGLLILFGMFSAAPIGAIGEIAGGLLFLAALIYLVWDVTDINLRVEDVVLSSSVAPEFANNPEEVVLHPDDAKLDGTITVSVTSEIPSGIHQLFDWIVNNAIGAFDREVRQEIEKALRRALTNAFRALPHFRLPLAQHASVSVPFIDPQGTVPPGAVSTSVDTPRHRMEAILANGVDDTMLSASSLTSMEFPFPTLQPYLTQVDPDSRDKLAELLEELAGESNLLLGKPLFGYAVSQNLLNGVVFSQWLAGHYQVRYSAERVDEAFAVLVSACPECDALTEREIHLWAAASPYVQVTPRGFLQDGHRRYLSVTFPDVRLCIGGIAGKASSLEVQFSITATAHVAFGSENKDGWTLFTVDADPRRVQDFLHVLFDERDGFHSISPSGTQGLETSGPGFAVIAEMDEAARLQFLIDIRPILSAAAPRLLHRKSAIALVFEEGSELVSRQICNGMFAIDFVPRRAALYATCRVRGPAQVVMPSRDDSGQIVGSLDTKTCAEGRDLLDSVLSRPRIKLDGGLFPERLLLPSPISALARHRKGDVARPRRHPSRSASTSSRCRGWRRRAAGILAWTRSASWPTSTTSTPIAPACGAGAVAFERAASSTCRS